MFGRKSFKIDNSFTFLMQLDDELLIKYMQNNCGVTEFISERKSAKLNTLKLRYKACVSFKTASTIVVVTIL